MLRSSVPNICDNDHALLVVFQALRFLECHMAIRSNPKEQILSLAWPTKLLESLSQKDVPMGRGQLT